MQNNPTNIKIRQSNYELLRVFSMFLIVLYHLTIFVFAPNHPDELIYKAIQMPLHMGVPLFVLISGYFGIKFSFRSLIPLLTKVYIYVIPISVTYAFLSNQEPKEILSSFQVIGLNKYWFINCYLCLYFVAPAINMYLCNTNERNKWVLLISLAIMTFYVGDIKMSDPSLVDGKNLLNFLFLYVVGHFLRNYQAFIRNIPWWILFIVFIIIGATEIVSYLITNSVFIQHRIWALCFPYNSPILILMSVIVFIMFGRLKIQSQVINDIAISVFAVYLIHGGNSSSPTWHELTKCISSYTYSIANPILCIITSILVCILIMTICILIDKALSPLWKWTQRIGEMIDIRN